jgi:hypothetical protein
MFTIASELRFFAFPIPWYFGHFGIEELQSALESISVTPSRTGIAAQYSQNPPQSTTRERSEYQLTY